jgi:UDPglucose--hexose-1-phosphate uridylyltransferase
VNSFPQLRKDPIVDRWVLIAPERARRPFQLSEVATTSVADWCPFCEGEEGRTPPEVFAIRRRDSRPDAPGWTLRVVPNIFPAARRDAPTCEVTGFFEAAPGYGVHEIVVEAPQHESSVAALSETQVRAVFGVFRQRLSAHSTDPRLKYVQIFKNHGAAAGATVEHVHSQILGVPVVPREVTAELNGVENHHRLTGRCIYCDMVGRELTDGARVVATTENCVAIAAFAGRFPFETWVLPRRHEHDFRKTHDATLEETADLIRSILRQLEKLIDRPSYNLALHTSPLHDADRPGYHWHWEILPRVTGIAGFELAAGCFINPLPPELAAERLREGQAP